MDIQGKISERGDSCDRCRDLGLPHDTIRPGEEYIQFANKDRQSKCCMGCWRALLSEIGKPE